MAQKHSTQDRYDTFEIYQKRLEILVGGKWRDRSTLMNAAREQDRIRKELSEKLKGWDSTAEIRKWRETRCSSQMSQSFSSWDLQEFPRCSNKIN